MEKPVDIVDDVEKVAVFATECVNFHCMTRGFDTGGAGLLCTKKSTDSNSQNC